MKIESSLNLERSFSVRACVCLSLTWCSWRQRGGGPGGAVAASCRDLVDVFPLKHGDHRWFPDVVGVTQTELEETPDPPPRGLHLT